MTHNGYPSTRFNASYTKIKNLYHRAWGNYPSDKNTDNHNEPRTLLHITHWKAGSQWINKIFHHCAYEKIESIRWKDYHINTKEILSQKVYPAIYITFERFKLLKLPENYDVFVIIRDLRDTLISLYFSLKVSHPKTYETEHHSAFRQNLNKLNLEEGLILLIKESLHNSAKIQASWLYSGFNPIIKYEDLIKNDVEILTPIISKSLLIPEEQVTSSILANRFDAITKGRKRGMEDIHSHERKGIVGDWKNYFTPHVKDEFKIRFGDLLIQTGYENNFDW